MRSIRTMGCIALLGVLLVSCDTDEVLQIGDQTFELAFQAGGAVVPVYNVYDGFEDNDGDMQADDIDGDGQGDFFLWCLATNPVQTTNAPSIPYGYTVEITILRDGQTVREQITSQDALDDSTSSLSNYDPTGRIFGAVAMLQPQMLGGRTFRFTNGRKLSSARRDIVAATLTQPTAWGMGNPLSTSDPATYGLGNGLCSDEDPGDPAVDRGNTTSYPLQIVLAKGDTVTVKARRATSPPAGIQVNNPPQPALIADFRRNNQNVAVRGETVSPAAPAGAVNFSFTSR